jgi:DNA-binding beta-propeller fold protein YncE
MRLAAICISIMLLASCSSGRAAIDYTMAEGIVWPGTPEKPRMQYLWSIQRITGALKSGSVLEAIAGGYSHGNILESRESPLLINPHGVFVDDRNILYITDTGAARVAVVDLSSMSSSFIIGDRDFTLSSPIGVVSDGKGRIYITDSELRRVIVFSNNGKFKFFFEGDFKRPTGIAIDLEAQKVYIADTWAHKIFVYTLEGKRIGSFGSLGKNIGQLKYPTHLAVGPQGKVYVSDTLNFRVQIFSPAGEVQSSFGLAGDNFQYFDKIKGIALDSEGHIYVTDSAQDMVMIYDQQGRLLLFFGKKGSFYGDFYLPAGIYIDKQDRVFVADALNGRVQAFQYLADTALRQQ